jgi:hypothetical protein
MIFEYCVSGLALGAQVVEMLPRLLKLLTGQSQRFIDRFAVRSHQRGIAIQEFCHSSQGAIKCTQLRSNVLLPPPPPTLVIGIRREPETVSP